MAGAQQQIRRNIGSTLGKGKKSHHGGSNNKWLVNSIYVVLGLLVLHIMMSQGDPPQIRPTTVSSKTTSSRQSKQEEASTRLAADHTITFADNSHNKRLPSYRRPEHLRAVSDLIAEGAIFDQLLVEKQSNNNKKESKDNVKTKTLDEEDEKEKEDNNNNVVGDLVEENHSSNDENGAENKDRESLAVDAKTKGRDDNDDGERPNEEDGEDEYRNDNGETEDEDEEISANVQALKASVNQVLLHFRNAAHKKMELSMNDLRTAMEKYKPDISTMLSVLSKKLFPGDSAMRVEEFVFLQWEATVVTQLQEQVDLWIAHASDDIDQVVADNEEQGLDVIEIDNKLAQFESEKMHFLYDEIDSITNGLEGQLKDTLPTVTKDSVEGLFPPMSLRFDVYDQLEMDESSSQGISLTEDRIEAAINFAMGIDDGGSEDEKSTDEAKVQDKGKNAAEDELRKDYLDDPRVDKDEDGNDADNDTGIGAKKRASKHDDGEGSDGEDTSRGVKKSIDVGGDADGDDGKDIEAKNADGENDPENAHATDKVEDGDENEGEGDNSYAEAHNTTDNDGDTGFKARIKAKNADGEDDPENAHATDDDEDDDENDDENEGRGDNTYAEADNTADNSGETGFKSHIKAKKFYGNDDPENANATDEDGDENGDESEGDNIDSEVDNTTDNDSDTGFKARVKAKNADGEDYQENANGTDEEEDGYGDKNEGEGNNTDVEADNTTENDGDNSFRARVNAKIADGNDDPKNANATDEDEDDDESEGDNTDAEADNTTDIDGDNSFKPHITAKNVDGDEDPESVNATDEDEDDDESEGDNTEAEADNKTDHDGDTGFKSRIKAKNVDGDEDPESANANDEDENAVSKRK